MAFIVDVYTAALASDRGLQLGNEEFQRPLSFGTNWQKIRIGLHLAINGTGTLNNVGLAFGVCAGSNGYKSQTCTEWIGAHLGATMDNSTYTWVNGVATANYFSTAGIGLFTLTKINGVATNRSGGNATFYASAVPSTTRSIMYIDITKGTPYTGNPYNAGSVGNVQTDNSLSVFLQGLETDGTPTNTTVSGSTTWTHTGPSLMDTLSISWNRSTPAVTLYAVGVCRFT